MSTTIKVCPVCSVSWYADKPEKHMMTCTAGLVTEKTYGVGYNEDVDGTRTSLTEEQYIAFANVLARLRRETKEVGTFPFCNHKWDFKKDTCTKCGATYVWAIDK